MIISAWGRRYLASLRFHTLQLSIHVKSVANHRYFRQAMTFSRQFRRSAPRREGWHAHGRQRDAKDPGRGRNIAAAHDRNASIACEWLFNDTKTDIFNDRLQFAGDRAGAGAVMLR
jgi:hypothetical protein